MHWCQSSRKKSLNTFRMANILSQDYNTIGDYKLLSQIVSVILSGIHPLCQFTSNFQVCWHSCLPSHSVLLWRYLWYLSLGFGCALGLRLSVQFDCPWHLFHHEENMVNVFPAVVNSADAVICEFLCKQAGCHPDNLSVCLSVCQLNSLCVGMLHQVTHVPWGTLVICLLYLQTYNLTRIVLSKTNGS